MRDIREIYCNGCSHSAAGGLEVNRSLYDDVLVRDYYKEKYNVWWSVQEEVSFISKVASNLNCNFTNEAVSGGGSERVIRMAYDFVNKNWNIKENIFLILELPSLGRLDLYSRKLNEYIIGNIGFKSNDYNDNTIDYMHATRGYYTEEFQEDNLKLISPFKSYYENFFSRKSYFLKVSRDINTFFTFLKYHKIKFIFFGGEFSPSIQPYLKVNNLLKLKVGNIIIEDFHEFAVETKSTIAEECDFLTTDLHPGYFCHKNFGNLISDYIIENYDTF